MVPYINSCCNASVGVGSQAKRAGREGGDAVAARGEARGEVGREGGAREARCVRMGMRCWLCITHPLIKIIDE